MENLNRNNTSFPIKLFEHLKDIKISDEWNFLKYYQYIVKYYINNIDVNSRGLLLYHGMGMGKTMEGVAISMDNIDERQPIILLTKSLYENFKKDISKYMKLRTEHDSTYKLGSMPVNDINAYINKKYSFVSMNASNMMKQMVDAAEGEAAHELDTILENKMGNINKLGSLDNKLLIIDEAHNFFRAVTNGSKNAVELYDMVLDAKNLKIVLLSGTPIANDPFEIAVCFNMLAGTEKDPLLPTNYKDFYKYYVDDVNHLIKNKEKFQNRIMGLVSYVTHKSTPGKATNNKIMSKNVEFPEELPTIVEKVEMDPEQYVMYLLARDKEKEEKKRGFAIESSNIPAMQKPRDSRASSYRVKSRQISNYSLPPSFSIAKYSDIDPNSIPESAVDSPKLRQLYANLQKTPGLALVYSQFVGVGGLGIIQRYLKLHGYKEYKVVGSNDKYKISAPGIGNVDFILNQTVGAHDEIGQTDNTYMDTLMQKMGAGLHRNMNDIIASSRTSVSNREHKKPHKIHKDDNVLAVDSKRVQTVVFDVKTRKGKLSEILDTYKKSDYYRADNSQFEVYIAEHVDKIGNVHSVGYIILSFESDDYIELIDLHVFKEYRSFGIGAMLFTRAIEILEKSTVQCLRMKAYAEWQRKFGESLGASVIEKDNNGVYIMEYNKETVNGGIDGSGLSKISDSHTFESDGKQYSVKKLIELTKDNEVKKFNPRYWDHYLDEYTWRDNNNTDITPKMVLNARLKYKHHYDRILNAEIKYPVIITPDKEHIIDGIHRLAKCYVENCDRMSCVIATKEQMDAAEIIKTKQPKKKFTMGKKSNKTGGDDKIKYYAVIAGDVDVEDRQAIQNIFNSEANKYGGIIDVLLISSTGAEGLDLKNLRQVHIMEPYWNYGRLSQIKARGVRNDSHIALKPNERTVQPYIYLAISNDKPIKSTNIDANLLKQALDAKSDEAIPELTTDVELYTESMKNQIIIESFTQAIREVSIECLINDESKCRKCNPNDMPLFIKNFDLDIKAADPCKQYKEENVKAEEIIINGNTYYYVPDATSVFDYKIFEFDSSLNGYKAMLENTTLFSEIIDAVKLNTQLHVKK